jgi:hypothetical protein
VQTRTEGEPDAALFFAFHGMGKCGQLKTALRGDLDAGGAADVSLTIASWQYFIYTNSSTAG